MFLIGRCFVGAKREDPHVIAGVSRAGAQSEVAEEAIFSLYLAGLAWVPLLYGSNTLFAWGINAVLFPALAALYEISLLPRRKRHAVSLRHILLPAALFAAVVVWILLQTATWVPSSLDNPIWRMAGRALGRRVAGSISVDRDLTDFALLRLLTAASAFWLALQLGRDGRRARLLVGAVAATATLYAVYGIVAATAGPFPWLDIPSEGGRVSATFVDRDSFATYAGLGLIALAGHVLRLYGRNGTGSDGWRLSTFSFLEATGKGGALLFLAGFLLLAALLLSGSRGGVIATFLGLLLLGLLTRRGSGRLKTGLKAVLVFGSFLVAVTAAVFGGSFFGSSARRGLYDRNRMAVYVLTLRSIRDLPWLGYGYGTFADVFPMVRDRSLSVAGIWGQAHDTYLEVFQGLGLLFGSVLILSVVLLVLRCLKGAANRREGVMVPSVAASAALLVGSHALVDFSLQIEAVALTFVSLLGAGVAQSESSRIALED